MHIRHVSYLSEDLEAEMKARFGDDRAGVKGRVPVDDQGDRSLHLTSRLYTNGANPHYLPVPTTGVQGEDVSCSRVHSAACALRCISSSMQYQTPRPIKADIR